MRVRFAPSPTGQLHVGNARTALFNWLLARGQGGTFILRIEDTDAERSTRESEATILRDLRWLGLDWDEGPDLGGSLGPYRQSARLHLYESYAQELLNADAAYHCCCPPAQPEAVGFAPTKSEHLSMVMGPEHAPLSKRRGETSVGEFRAKGYLAEALVNYLALLGWSPGGSDELLPIDELARRFSLDAVGHSAGVFDEEKLAWANRHYLKLADPLRLAELSVPYFVEAGIAVHPDARGLEFLASAMPMASASVDRLA